MLVLSLPGLFAFLLVLVRLGALLLTFPLLNARVVPAHLKLVLLVALSLGLFPAARVTSPPLPHGVVHLALLLLGEMLLGMVLGFAAQFVFAGVQLGAELLSQHMGLSLATVFDPQEGHSNAVLTNFFYLVVALLFFSLNAHLWFVRAVAESLHAVPLLEAKAPPALLGEVLRLGAGMFVSALRLVAPLSGILLLTTVALGIMARLVPQMNVFILAFPINLAVGLLAVSLALPFLRGYWQQLVLQLGRDLLRVLHAVATG
ncbi:MAG: flagellar biosynthetic protein FliR [Candidatus Tectimicrobiota bacterium]|nr:MAG: flagellar biosynthetic protein FliR [Candidatus Tectomicrobia bacterium]